MFARKSAHVRARRLQTKNEIEGLTFLRTFGQIAVDARFWQQSGLHHRSERADALSLESLLSLIRIIPADILCPFASHRRIRRVTE